MSEGTRCDKPIPVGVGGSIIWSCLKNHGHDGPCYSDGKFEAAKFYDCRNSEVLTCTELPVALEEHFDMNYAKGETIQELIERMCPVEVAALVPREIYPEWICGVTDTALETLVEELEEEYGDMDGDWRPFTKEVRQQLGQEVHDVVEKYLNNVVPWQCECVERRVFNVEQVTAILKDQCPHWFEEKDDGQEQQDSVD